MTIESKMWPLECLHKLRWLSFSFEMTHVRTRLSYNLDKHTVGNVLQYRVFRLQYRIFKMEREVGDFYSGPYY
jgi:hypothetical protein